MPFSAEEEKRWTESISKIIRDFLQTREHPANEVLIGNWPRESISKYTVPISAIMYCIFV